MVASHISITRRQGELKSGSGAIIREGPQTTSVCLHRRPADRKAHAKPLLLRCIEGIKELSGMLFIEADTTVPHTHEHTSSVVSQRFDQELARSSNTTHCFDG